MISPIVDNPQGRLLFKPDPSPQPARSMFDQGLPEHKPYKKPAAAKIWKERHHRPRRFVTDKLKLVAQETCARCNQEFEPARRDAKFCGSICRQAAYRARIAADGEVRT